jgi:hypothetical protein
VPVKATKAATELEPQDDKTQQEIPSKVPKPPARNFNAAHSDQFFTYLQSIPEDEWSHLTVYLYRSWPVIVRQKKEASAPNYIDKYPKAIELSDVRNRWGSGTYQLRLTDSNKAKYGELCSVIVKIEDNWESCPPVIDPAELDEQHRDNSSYVGWARSKGLMQNPAAAAQPNDGATMGLLRELISDLRQRKPANAIEEQTTAKMLTMLEQANTRSIEMVTRAAGQNEPVAMLKVVAELRSLFAPAESGSGNNKMLELLMQQNNLLMGKLLDKPATPATAPGTGDLGQLTAAFDLIERLQDKFGGGEKGSGNTWADLGRAALEKVPDTLDRLTKLFAVMNASPAARGPQARPAPATHVQNGPEGLPPAEAPPEPAAEDEDVMKLQILVDQFGGMLISALQRGVTGDAFAEAIETSYGPMIYNQVAGVGAEKLLAALKVHPIWQQLAAIEPQVIQFVNEFFAYGTEADPPGDDDDEEDERTPILKTRPGKGPNAA